MNWNRGIPGATFSIINKDSLHETGRFCWTPDHDDANDLPYTFIATASDHYCPINAQTLRSFRVYVKHKTIVDRRFTRLGDGRVLVEALWPTTARGTPSGSYWQVMDQTGTIITDNSIARFSSSDSFWSTKMVDTLYLKNSGTYRFSFLINNLPNNCPVTYDDTYVYHTLGVDNLKDAAQIVLYPNPCQDKLQIRTSGLMACQVIDINGRLILQGSIGNSEWSLDISTLNVGVYNLILSNGSKQSHKRFVKVPEF